MSKIILEAKRAPYGRFNLEGESFPAGLEITEHSGSYVDDDGKNVPYTYRSFRYPQITEPRHYSWQTYRKGLVVKLPDGNNYLIRVEVVSDDDIPNGAFVVMVPTDEPETPWETFDPKKAMEDSIARLEKDIADEVAELKGAGEDDARWAQQHINYLRNLLKRDKDALEVGQCHYRCPLPVQFFGQPDWVQNECFPADEDGNSAFHLCTLNTRWGDCGNVNVLCSLKDGKIDRVWWEASCA